MTRQRRSKRTAWAPKRPPSRPATRTTSAANAILREAIDAQVILRVGRRMPPIRPIAGVHAPIAVVRMAVDGAYGAKEWREGEGLDEIAYRTEHITRRTCRIVAEFAFQHAERTAAKVFGGPKFTVSPVYEGMFKKNSTPPRRVTRRCGTIPS